MGETENILEDIPAHEFHYGSLEDLSEDLDYAYKVIRGHGIDGEHDGLIINNLTACFAHQRNLTSNCWAESFVAFVDQQKTTSQAGPVDPATLTA